MVWRRRRRRWPWVLLILFGLCAGGCGWVVNTVRPFIDQYPSSVSANRQVSGLLRINEGDPRAGVKDLLKKVQSLIDEGSFADVYQDASDRGRSVTVFGVTRFVPRPAHDLDEALDHLNSDLALTGRHEVATGPLGGAARCGNGTRSERPVVVCGWADHGSLAVALFTDYPEDEAVVLTQTLHAVLIDRG